jgi:iron complex outermembrane receptor protein
MRGYVRDRSVARAAKFDRWRASATSALALLAGALLMGTTSIPASAQSAQPAPQGQTERRLSFDIPAQDLNGAVLAFADKAGIQVFYDVSRVQGLRSNGVRGDLTAQEALGRILAGTGLTFHFTGAKAVSLDKATVDATGADAAGAGVAANGATALPAVQVQGNDATTEDTGEARINDPQQITAVSKTGTKLEDLPSSVQVIPHEVLEQQGATMLRSAITNASGVNEGGADSLGFFDRFQIRGLDARIYSDGLSDGDQLNGIPHSLNGIERVEILEGPGSALFGSGPPGGTINLVHYEPSSTFHTGGSIQGGSFATVTGSAYVTGPTGIQGLDFRVDATVERSDGYRDLDSRDYEIRPVLTWQLDDHVIDFSLDARHIHQTPDSYGLIYLNGSPIKDVSRESKYSTPFAHGDQDIIRPTLSDKWDVTDYLTVTNRFSYMHRSVDILRNGDSGMVVGDEFTHRQLREQDDTDNTYYYQLEPVWKFDTGSVRHTLLTGFEFQHQDLHTNRATADLPNITDIFSPDIPESSTDDLTFLRDKTHSGAIDDLSATYLSLYATDQVDVTDDLKLRGGIRKDWWDTSIDPQAFVPDRLGPDGDPLEPGDTEKRKDAPVSWNIGALYKILPGVSPYVGVSKSYLANFNSENTQNGIAEPESALQYEAGIKFSLFDDKVVLNTAAFHVKRKNVAALLGDEPVFNSQRTEGVEADLDAQVTDQWHLLANVTAQDAELTSDPSSVTAKGNHPQGVPAYIANLWTTYDFSLAGIEGFQIGAGLNYRGKSYGNITNTNSIPSYVIANAEIGYQAENWGASVDVRNITNKRYFIAANGGGALVGEPLSAFLNVHVNY